MHLLEKKLEIAGRAAAYHSPPPRDHDYGYIDDSIFVDYIEEIMGT